MANGESRGRDGEMRGRTVEQGRGVGDVFEVERGARSPGFWRGYGEGEGETEERKMQEIHLR